MVIEISHKDKTEIERHRDILIERIESGLGSELKYNSMNSLKTFIDDRFTIMFQELFRPKQWEQDNENK